MSQSQCPIRHVPNKGNKALISVKVLSLSAFLAGILPFIGWSNYWFNYWLYETPIYIGLITTIFHQCHWWITVPKGIHGLFAGVSLLNAGFYFCSVSDFIWHLDRNNNVKKFQILAGMLWLIAGVVEIVAILPYKKSDETNENTVDHDRDEEAAAAPADSTNEEEAVANTRRCRIAKKEGLFLIVSIQILSLLAFFLGNKPYAAFVSIYPPFSWPWCHKVAFWLSLILTICHQLFWCYTVPVGAHWVSALAAFINAGFYLFIGIQTWRAFAMSLPLFLHQLQWAAGFFVLFVGILEIIYALKQMEETRLKNHNAVRDGDAVLLDEEAVVFDKKAVAVHVEGTKITLPE